MKLFKSISFIVVPALLFFIICLPASGTERVKRKSMDELTNPNLPSYVPCPHPKNRTQVIKNIKYYVANNCAGNCAGKIRVALDPNVDDFDRIWNECLRPNSKFKIGTITKVKNRSCKFADDYTWLIYVMNTDGHIVLTAAMDADGNIFSEGVLTDKDFESAPPHTQERWKNFRKELSEKDIIGFLEKALGKSVEKNAIKKVDRVVYMAGRISDFKRPLWEIEMKDGRIYYYSIKANCVFRIDRKISWKPTKDRKTLNQYRKTIEEIYSKPGTESFVDDIEDVRFILKKVKVNQ